MSVAPLEKEFDERTVSDWRVAIGNHVGTHERGSTRLSKRTWNSIYAYLTGEFAVHPNHILDIDSKHFKTREEIVRRTLFKIFDSKSKRKLLRHFHILEHGEDSDSWPCGLRTPSDMADAGQLRKAELRVLHQVLNSSEDQRDWTP